MCARLKDITRALWSNSNAEEDPAGKGNSPEALAGSWSDFEQWIRATIGSDFIWKAREVLFCRLRDLPALHCAQEVINDGGCVDFAPSAASSAA